MREAIGALGIGAVAIACCALLPILAGAASGVALAPLLGAGAAVVLAGVLSAGLITQRRRRHCERTTPDRR